LPSGMAGPGILLRVLQAVAGVQRPQRIADQATRIVPFPPLVPRVEDDRVAEIMGPRRPRRVPAEATRESAGGPRPSLARPPWGPPGHAIRARRAHAGPPRPPEPAMTPKNLVCLWFDGDALDAAEFYARTFPDSRVGTIYRAPMDWPAGKAGDVLTVEFTVLGIP